MDDKERKYTVYKHTSPNDRVYIGITRQNPAEKRWANGRGYTQNDYFNKDIILYGWDSFRHEILFSNLTRFEARQKEIELIKHYKSTDKKFGYNIRAGNPEKISEKIEIKMSKRNKGKNKMSVTQYTCLGEFIRVFDSVSAAEMDTGVCGTNIIKCCEEILQSAGSFVWRYTDSDFNLIDYNYKINKQIIQYTKKGIFVQMYNSITAASKDNNIDQSSITKCCKRKVQTAGGFIWRYALDIDNPTSPLFSTLSETA